MKKHRLLKSAAALGLAFIMSTGTVYGSDLPWIFSDMVEDYDGKISRGERIIKQALEATIPVDEPIQMDEEVVFDRTTVSQETLNNITGWLLNRELYKEESILFGTPIMNESNQPAFDKNTVYRHIKDLYGQEISDETFAGDNFVLLNESRIGVIGADGEAVPIVKIKHLDPEGSSLYVDFTYTMSYNLPEYDYSGTGTAVFSENLESFLGYTLDQVQTSQLV